LADAGDDPVVRKVVDQLVGPAAILCPPATERKIGGPRTSV
jgi:hypothetical protein